MRKISYPCPRADKFTLQRRTLDIGKGRIMKKKKCLSKRWLCATWKELGGGKGTRGELYQYILVKNNLKQRKIALNNINCFSMLILNQRARLSVHPRPQSPWWFDHSQHHGTPVWNHRLYSTFPLEEQKQNRHRKFSFWRDMGFACFIAPLLCYNWISCS